MGAKSWAAAAALAAPVWAAAWGATGHRTVGEIAQHHLTAAAARRIAVLLDGDSLAEIADWADDIRSDPAWKRASPWHYIDVEDDQTLASAPRSPAGDVLWALEHFEGVLRDPAASTAERAEALRFYVHFVGDVHQPLHVGRHADQGGNTIDVTWFGAPRNLHQVWDDAMIDSTDLSFTELTRFLDDPTPAEVAAWQADPYATWIAESKALRGLVYDIGDGRLSWRYRFRTLPTLKHRLLQAGVRLAGKLNDIFSAPAAPGAP